MNERGPDSAPPIELIGVRKAFRGHLGLGRTVAVDGLDLVVERGEIFGLLGPNGAGKTTTLKMMLGLLRPDRGQLRLLGLSPSDAACRARIGYLPESPYFYSYLTAREFLDFYARLQGIPSAERGDRVAAALTLVGLAGREDAALHKLSKGMIQRLGLAQALQHEPELVILDEPMSGLDPIGRHDVRDLILSLREAGRTVLFSSHILQDAEMLCDRVGILVEGRLRSSGRLLDLIPSHERWFEVSIRGPLPPSNGTQLLSTDGVQSLLRVENVDALGRLLAAVPASGSQVLSIWPRRETLEDLFLEQVGARARRRAER